MPIQNPFKKLFAAGVDKVIETTGKAIDSIFTNDEERMAKNNELAKIKADAAAEINRHFEEMSSQALELEKAYLADVQSARTMQIAALNQSDIFSKRYLYYLATGIIGAAIAFGVGLMFVQIPKENQRLVEMFADVFLFAGAMIVIQFFFGSSKSSHDKENTRNVLEATKTASQN